MPTLCASGDILVIDVAPMLLLLLFDMFAPSLTSGVVDVAASGVATVVVPNVAPRESPVALAISLAAASCRMLLLYALLRHPCLTYTSIAFTGK